MFCGFGLTRPGTKRKTNKRDNLISNELQPSELQWSIGRDDHRSHLDIWFVWGRRGKRLATENKKKNHQGGDGGFSSSPLYLVRFLVFLCRKPEKSLRSPLAAQCNNKPTTLGVITRHTTTVPYLLWMGRVFCFSASSFPKHSSLPIISTKQRHFFRLSFYLPAAEKDELDIKKSAF